MPFDRIVSRDTHNSWLLDTGSRVSQWKPFVKLKIKVETHEPQPRFPLLTKITTCVVVCVPWIEQKPSPISPPVPIRRFWPRNVFLPDTSPSRTISPTTYAQRIFYSTTGNSLLPAFPNVSRRFPDLRGLFGSCATRISDWLAFCWDKWVEFLFGLGDLKFLIGWTRIGLVQTCCSLVWWIWSWIEDYQVGCWRISRLIMVKSVLRCFNELYSRVAHIIMSSKEYLDLEC